MSDPGLIVHWKAIANMNEVPAEFGISDGQTAPPVAPVPDRSPPWEMIENGRYQPRRIKGSCVGRELG